MTSPGDGYKEFIGIGKDAAESYTCEFTLDGLAERLCTHSGGETRSVAALSVDLGNAPDLQLENRKVPWLILKWLDIVFFSGIARDAALAILNVKTSCSQGTTFESAVREAPPVTLTTPFAAIRCDRAGEFVWVYSAGDETAEDLKRQILALQKEASWICLMGPSGSGKTTCLAKALHYFSLRNRGPYHVVNASDLNSDIGRLKVTGATEGAYTTKGSTVVASCFERANRGTLVLDEIFTLNEETLDYLNPVLTKLENGEDLEKQGPGKDKEVFFKVDVRLITTGIHKDKQPFFNEQHSRRLEKGKLWVPGWGDLSRESRITLIRWNLIRALAKQKLSTGRISEELFNALVDSEPPLAYLTGAKGPNSPGGGKNFGGLKDLWDTLAAKCEDGRFTLAAIMSQLKGDEDPDRLKLLATEAMNESFPDDLMIGTGSAFERGLDNFETLIVELAKASRKPRREKIPDHLVDAALKTAAEGPATTPPVLGAHYLILAAISASIERKEEQSVVLGTEVKPLYDYLDRDKYVEWFRAQIRPHKDAVLRVRNEAVARKKSRNGDDDPSQREDDDRDLVPVDFEIRGIANTKHRGSAFFQKYVEELAVDELLRRVEKIACAYPPFLTTVPFYKPRRFDFETEAHDSSSNITGVPAAGERTPAKGI